MDELESSGRRGSRTSDVQPRCRAFTLARVVVLVVIGVLVAGLAYLRFAPGDEPVAVPAGAKAGDLILKPCSYVTEQGDQAGARRRLVLGHDQRAAVGRHGKLGARDRAQAVAFAYEAGVIPIGSLDV